jgi:Protein of unknown function DUF115.
MENGKLTDSENASINAWNEHAGEVTEEAMRHFLASWFTNARALIKANFVPQSIEKLCEKLEDKQSIVVLGSGPSVTNIVKNIPKDPNIAIFCGPTAVGASLVENRKPDVVMVADSNPLQYDILRDLSPSDAKNWILVLPVTADPSWYSEESIFDRKNMYFYLPYLSFFASTDLAYNDILRVLFPDVHRWIVQAGSVANAMLSFADMCCGNSETKRIYLGIDCCGWLGTEYVSPLLRAPAAELQLDGKYKVSFENWHIDQNIAAAENALILDYSGMKLQTNLTSLGYAIQMLYLVNNYMEGEYRKDRFIMLIESCALFYKASLESVTMPTCLSSDIGSSKNLISSDRWAYNAMLKIIEISNAHRKALIEASSKLEAKYER